MAVCAVCSYGQQPAKVTWDSPADVRSEEPQDSEEIKII